MNVQDKIIYIFNKFLICFFKEIKKENYFKVAIKKKYKVIDKNSDLHIKYFSKKIIEFKKLLCNTELELPILLENKEFTEINIFKNINVGRLFRVFTGEEDKKTITSYILTLLLLSIFYQESILKKKKQNEEILDDDEDTELPIEDTELPIEEIDNEEDNEEDSDEDSEEDNEEDNEEDSEEDSEEVLNVVLLKSLHIINNNSKLSDLEDELNEILDDDIKGLLINIKNLKINLTTDKNMNNGSLDDLLEGSQIGKLAKEISSKIDIDSLNLNINNPAELLNPANLFSGENGNILGDLVQQVGSSITNKMNSGELKQEDLVKDAFSLMNKMQTNGSGNPILDNMMGSMMNNKDDGDDGDGDGETPGMDINSMMKNMMGGINPDMMQQMMSGMGGGGNNDMMQQMMNSMGGTQAVNQMNPNSREGKAKARLKKKLAEKNN